MRHPRLEHAGPGAGRGGRRSGQRLSLFPTRRSAAVVHPRRREQERCPALRPGTHTGIHHLCHEDGVVAARDGVGHPALEPPRTGDDERVARGRSGLEVLAVELAALDGGRAEERVAHVELIVGEDADRERARAGDEGATSRVRLHPGDHQRRIEAGLGEPIDAGGAVVGTVRGGQDIQPVVDGV